MCISEQVNNFVLMILAIVVGLYQGLSVFVRAYRGLFQCIVRNDVDFAVKCILY